jgi:uncharacterized membrane protein SpoIIM required for sporulation
MDVNDCIRRQQGGWMQLDELVGRVERGGFQSLRADQVRLLHQLYRRSSADLILAQTVLANGELVDYLNDLVGRSYAAIYAVNRPSFWPVVEFFVAGFPQLVRGTWRFTAAAAAILIVSAVIGFVTVLADEQAVHFLLPAGFAGMERPSEARQRGHDLTGGDASLASAQIMTNNIRVTLTCFASGLLTCVFTVAIVFYNGLMLGALYGRFFLWGVNLNFWSLILAHGVIELTCICIGAGAGLMLGVAVLAPGSRTRTEALVERGRDAVRLLLGVTPLLVLAGLIEGFITPLPWLSPLAKIGFAALTGVLLVAYLGFAGKITPTVARNPKH